MYGLKSFQTLIQCLFNQEISRKPIELGMNPFLLSSLRDHIRCKSVNFNDFGKSGVVHSFLILKGPFSEPIVKNSPGFSKGTDYAFHVGCFICEV